MFLSPIRLAFCSAIAALGCAHSFAADFDVRSYGATGDGRTIDSPAINKAIDAAAAAGGGTVYFPAGTYECFSIHLKSHITLSLGSGSTIVADEHTADLSTGYDAHQSLIQSRNNIRTLDIPTGTTVSSGARTSKTFRSSGRVAFTATD